MHKEHEKEDHPYSFYLKLYIHKQALNTEIHSFKLSDLLSKCFKKKEKLINMLCQFCFFSLSHDVRLL